MTTIAVTGASGFLGRHVLNYLAERNLDVIAVSRSGEAQIDYDRVTWAALDVQNLPANPFHALGQPDTMLHLAWGGLPDYRNAYQLEIELPAQKEFLESMIKGGLPSLTVAGTCLEYGMQSGCLTENMPCKPTLAYPKAKLALLDYLMEMKTHSPFALTWARLFYMYGEGQQERSLYSLFRAAHARGDKSFDMSGGEQLRDFLSVEDIAGYLAMLALSGTDNGIVNVCSGKPVSVRELVEGWAAALDWDVDLNLGVFPYPDYEPMEFWGDNSCLKALVAQQ